MALTMMKALVVVLVLMACFPSGSRAACGDYTVCSTCVVDLSCGWCLGPGVAKCMSGDATGPNQVQNQNLCSSWQYQHSQVVSSTAGFPVSPGTINVFLYPGQPVNVTIQVTPLQTANQKLDLFVVQDASASMDDDLVTFRTLVPNLVNSILAYRDDSYFGLTSFIEKPMRPMGKYDGTNYIYKLHTSLTNDYNKLLQAVSSVTTSGNVDWCECSLDGMAFTMIDPAAGWRPDSQKVMVLATDACFHQANDTLLVKKPYSTSNCDNPYDECCYYPNGDYYPGGVCPYALKPNDLNMVFDVYDTKNTKLNQPGSGEDYVSKEQLKSLLLKKNIVPIFAITDTSSSPQEEYKLFSDLLAYIGFGGIYPLSSDSSNLVQAIVSSLDTLSRTVTMGVATDDYKYVQSFYPTTYTNVDVTKVQNFNVTFLAPSAPVRDTTVQLSVLGFGSVFINILSKLPCAGCDGVPNSNTYIDKCGVCNGNNGCADCNGDAFGSAVVDVCNVCGGNGDSCLGCDRVPNSGVKLDACGVCGGKNECVGCDLVPRSQPYVKDLCGVCGGNDSCLDCASVPFGNLVLDACGVCGGKNACVGCDGSLSYPPKVNDTCGVCGGNDACYDCFGVKHGTAVYDKCGVCNGNNSCEGCDHKFDPNNKLVNDSCGVCGGDGKSCAGCDGIAKSNVTYDQCGICGGNNTCLGCDKVPNSGAIIQCGVCGGNTSCIGCDNKEFSGKQWDRCGICGGNNTCLGCDGVPYSGKTFDICYVCGGDGTSCLGCDLIANSSKILDNCGICGGNNTCLGCDEKPNSGLVYDRCKVCGGNDSCLGCDGVPFSGLEIDDCGVCPNAPNYKPNACAGCDGVLYSGVKNDSCGVCNGNNTCVGCDGVINSGIVLDDCGNCPVSSNYTAKACYGCDGKPNSGLQLDDCDVCPNVANYTRNACAGCDLIPNSGAKNDSCGVCKGNNACVGCDNEPFSGKVNDTCGVCGGNGASCLSGCDHKPFSTAVIDKCQVCGGDNTTCDGKQWYLETRTITIAAGTIGGTLVGVAALVAGLFLYKRLTAGAMWYIPKDLLDSTTSVVAENPLFESSGTGFAENPLFTND